MDDFREQFLSDSIEKLDNLIADFENVKSISGSIKSELLRCLHTIKGGAQVFGLKHASVLAHNLENLVLSRRIQNGVEPQVQQELIVLKNSLANPDEPESQEVITRFGLQDVFSDKIPSADEFSIPPNLISKLSTQEKTTLKNELRSGNTLFCIDVEFDGAAFGSQLTAARGILDDSGTVIAAIPGSNFGLNGLFGFEFLFASSNQTEDIGKTVDELGGKITYCSSEVQNNLHEMVSIAVSHGKEIAGVLGKSIEFYVWIDEIEISSANVKLIFESLLHLVRNAVDHAFERSGTLKIRINNAETGIVIVVSDDGKGIDLAKIRAIAKEKSLVPDIEDLPDEATLALIFQSELSTAPQITEISGRGIGLDAVKSSIEKAGGTISVKSEIGKGTTFSINLPDSD